MKQLIVLLSVLALTSGSAFATSTKAAPAPAKKTIALEGDTANMASPDHYDGCGLGWQVTQKKTMIATTTRGTTNAFVPPTFGMTSGTIGCDQISFAKKETPALNFVATNYEPLMMEMAQGKGEYLTAFSRIVGCNDSATAAFGKMSQERFPAIIGSGSNSVEMYKNIKKEIQSDAFLAASCNG